MNDMELPAGLPIASTGPDCRRCTFPTTRSTQPLHYFDSCSDCLIVEVTDRW